MNSHSPFAIISAYRAATTNSNNQVQHYKLKSRLELNGFLFKEVSGSYENQHELSFLVILPSDYTTRLNTLLSIAVLHQQQTVLFVSALREASLVNCRDRQDEYLGQWVNVSKTEALKQTAYTYDPAFDSYFITSKGRKTQ